MKIEKAKEILKNSKNVAVLTGAGISAESGIPTFRGEGGYWRNYRSEDLATPEAFSRDPQLVWSWYEMRRGVCLNAQPNPGHKIIAEMENYYPEFLVITQNVDGLHARAGNKKLLQIHGDIFTSRCTDCMTIEHFDEHPLSTNPPLCPSCGGLLRPHIVWFGEAYFPGMIDKCLNFLKSVDTICIIGTSGQVSVPVQLAEYAISQGAKSIEINPSTSTLTELVDIALQAPAGEILPKIWDK
ncbi:MAG: NAD-dependent deacylase [Leptospiraceae bacterium]|nr:NAD-dependent deacylase [Leptospiraceae bacterium]MCP5513545.1 NAD-dependent deacylase [Leptospiraceae bacterium]